MSSHLKTLQVVRICLIEHPVEPEGSHGKHEEVVVFSRCKLFLVTDQ